MTVVNEIHYRDMDGALLWKEPMIFSRLFAIGQDFIEDSVRYIVRRVAVADGVQHGNVEKV